VTQGTVAGAPVALPAHEVHHRGTGLLAQGTSSRTDHKVIGIQYAVTGLLFLSLASR
jgi:hypothetical protein